MGFGFGESNPSWVGDNITYMGVHDWVRKRFPKPEFCQRCGLVPPRDLANKDGQYKRDLDNWEYLCRKCHMDEDGRNDILRKSGKSRRLPSAICPICGKEYGSKYGKINKYCSKECWTSGRTGAVRGPYKKSYEI